jgi:murein DD-endopeptidase MepM/ murein hydrolase activator NlpD
MNKIQKYNFVYFLLFFAVFSYNAAGQFNTLLPKEKIKEEVVDEIIAEAQGTNSTSTRKVESLQSIKIDEEKQYVIDGMNRRQNLALPIDQINVNSPYGYRNDPITRKRTFHRGIDLDADFNYVYCIMPGKVVKSGKNRELGEFVQIEHGEFITTYGHLFQRLVNRKEAVEAGQPIGISGSSGRSTGEHLHFGVLFNGKSIDPMPILNYIQYVMQEAKIEIEKALSNFNINK